MKYKLPIVSERLSFRPFIIEDAEFFYKHIDLDEEVMKFLGGVKNWSRSEQHQVFTGQINKWNNSNFGPLAVCLKDSNKLIGWCGIKPHKEVEGIELFYGYAKRFWGNGYGTEAATQIVTQAFEVFELDELIGLAHPDNISSRRILEKVGMTYEKDVKLKDYEVGIHLYKMTKIME